MLRMVFFASNSRKRRTAAEPAGISRRRARSVYANGATVGATTRPRRKGFARRGIADTRIPRKTACITPKLQRCGALGGYRITRGYEAVTNGWDLPDQPARPPQRRCEAILTVGYRKRGPAICGGCESREETTN